MPSKNHIDCLDGLRGLAALWVLVGHACLLTGLSVPVLGQPDLGVDLFVILSGFLMAFHYQRPATWSGFWQRRFFRIAPLYYVLLAVALIAGPMLFDAREVIDTALNRSHQQVSRYEDHSLLNIALHATFLFGLIPEYAFRTPLPDWSLGLEMQFYALFPALILMTRRFGWLVSALIICAVSVVIVLAMRRAGISFPLPSFLPLKMPFFLVGMLCAAAIDQKPRTVAIYLVAALVFAAVPLTGFNPEKLAVRLAVVAGFFALVHHRHLGPGEAATSWISRLLGTKPFHWLGELSFGAYLWHLLIMQPVVAWSFVSAPALSPPARFFITCAAVIALTYALAFMTYRLVEGPGQALGRSLSGWRRPAPVIAG